MNLKRFIQGFLLTLAVAICFQGNAWSELDTLYFANGEVVQGKVQEITGDFIRYKTVTGATSTVRRIELASRRDILETNRRKKYFGEIKLMGSFIIEIFTSQGQKEVWRLYKKKLILGLPQERDGNFIESDSQLQSPAKIFPPR